MSPCLLACLLPRQASKQASRGLLAYQQVCSGTSTRINVRCSRAGHKGASGGPQKGHEKTAAKDSKGWVPELGRHRARQKQHIPEIALEHAPSFSGSRTNLRCSTHQASVEVWGCGWGVVCSSPGRRPTFSENPGEFSSPSQNPGSHLQGIPGKSGNFAASFAGAPITPRERCYVTQPRARINVSCSRADHE